MNQRIAKFIDILIFLGFIFLIPVCVLSFSNNEIVSLSILYFVLLTFQISLGFVISIEAIMNSKKAYQLFMGILLFSWGIGIFVIHYFASSEIRVWWPIFSLLSGIDLFIAGVYKYKKLRFGFLIPGIVLIGMGLWYSLFSFGIIKVSFLTIAGFVGPFFMLGIAVLFLIFFLAQQKNKKLVFEDEDDVFSDEEITSIKPE